MSDPRDGSGAGATAAYSGTVLLTPQGLVILQLRDDKPEIRNPGGISLFGGGAEGAESPVACALRELSEETGLKLVAADLTFLGDLPKIEPGLVTLCSLYLARDVRAETLAIGEGRAIVLGFAEALGDARLTRSCRHALGVVAARFPERVSSAEKP